MSTPVFDNKCDTCRTEYSAKGSGLGRRDWCTKCNEDKTEERLKKLKEHAKENNL